MTSVARFFGRFLLAHVAAVAAGYAAAVVGMSIFVPATVLAALPMGIMLIPAIALLLLPFSLAAVVLLLKSGCLNKWTWIALGAIFPALFFLSVELWSVLDWKRGVVGSSKPDLVDDFWTWGGMSLALAPVGLVGGWVLWRMMVGGPAAVDEAAMA